MDIAQLRVIINRATVSLEKIEAFCVKYKLKEEAELIRTIDYQGLKLLSILARIKGQVEKDVLISSLIYLDLVIDAKQMVSDKIERALMKLE